VHHASAGSGLLVVDDVEDVPERSARLVPGVPRVHDERQAEPACETDLLAKRPPLILARRQIAVVVEPGLADRDDLRVRREPLELIEKRFAELSGLVRVEADRRVDELVALRELDRAEARLEIEADVHHDPYASGPRAANDVLAIAGVRIEVEMHVGV